MLKRFQEIVKGWLSPEGRPLLVAVSGGRDSVCLASLFRRSGVPFDVAHCNFRLRGAESDGDEAFVQRWAEENQAGFHHKNFDARGFAETQGVSVEMAARQLRYAWFEQLCRRFGYCAVAVGHHADDNAETLVLNMLRGSGSRGMSGMAVRGRLPVEGSAVELWRPLLSFTRTEIAAYMTEEGIPYREDRTNASDEYRRNRIRHQVFPVFEALNPAFVTALNRTAAHIAEVDSIADEFYFRWRGEVYDGEWVDTRRLVTLPHWRYILYRLVEEQGFNSVQAAEMEEAIERGASGRRFFAGGREAVTSAGRLHLSRSGTASGEAVLVSGPGAYRFGRVAFEVTVEDRSPEMPLRQPDGITVFDAAKLPFPFAVRGWCAGDWFRPLGLRGRKKLSDLFVDLKFSLPEKRSAAVAVLEGEHIAALLGRRIDDAVKVTPDTRRIVRITLRETGPGHSIN